jgi:hypothetical protein
VWGALGRYSPQQDSFTPVVVAVAVGGLHKLAAAQVVAAQAAPLA